MSLSHADLLDSIANAGRACEANLWWEHEALADGDLLAAADYADVAEACSTIAFNLARGRL